MNIEQLYFNYAQKHDITENQTQVIDALNQFQDYNLDKPIKDNTDNLLIVAKIPTAQLRNALPYLYDYIKVCNTVYSTGCKVVCVRYSQTYNINIHRSKNDNLKYRDVTRTEFRRNSSLLKEEVRDVYIGKQYLYSSGIRLLSRDNHDIFITEGATA